LIVTRVPKWNWQQADWPEWRFDATAVTGLERRFLLNAGALLGAWRHLTTDDQEQLKIDFLSDEAMTTSAIEGELLDRASVQSSVRRQFGLTADRRAGPAEAGIAALMVDCFTGFAAALTHEALFHWHDLVCQGRRDLRVIGGYRDHADPMQVVSGPLQKPKVHFEAPPSAVMQHEMNQLIRWFNTTNAPALTRAGIAHLWFVSIHPFEDGNGRIGRALAEKSLAQSLGQPSLLALSRQIEQERKAYYDLLEQNNRQMEITPWLVWFAETALRSQTYSIAMIELMIAKTRLLDRLRGQINDRQIKALLRLFEAGPDGFKGGLSAKNYMTITAAPTATATRDLRDLVAKGALRRTGELKATRYWLAV
jgi:Fic family protein